MRLAITDEIAEAGEALEIPYFLLATGIDFVTIVKTSGLTIDERARGVLTKQCSVGLRRIKTGEDDHALVFRYREYFNRRDQSL